MTISDDLFQLIKSLKQSEKRYFKIYSSTHVKGKKNNYVKLFEAIDRQSVYNEKIIIVQFKGEVFVKQFSVTKNYLYNFILKSLRSYYSGQDTASRINNGLESVKILYGKGLYKKCIKILKKVKKLGRTYEKYEQLLNILDWESEIMLRYLTVDELRDYREKARKEVQDIIAIIQNKNGLRLLADEAYELYRNYMIARSDEQLKKYEEILADPLLESCDKALSFEAKQSFHSIHAIYYTTQENHKAACTHNEKRLALIDEYDFMKEEELSNYIKVLNNLIHNYLGLKNYQSFLAILEKMRKIPEEYPQLITHTQEALIFETTYELELSYLFELKKFDQGLQKVTTIEEKLKQFDDVLLFEFKTSILFIVSKFYFYSGHLNEASDWVRQIVFDDKPSPADDLLCFARILNLLIHYDLGNYVHLQFEIKSTKRFLAKKKRLYQVESLVLKYLGKLVTANTNESPSLKLHYLYEEFQQELQQIMEQPFEHHAASYLNMVLWLQSKKENRPLKEIIMASKQTLGAA